MNDTRDAASAAPVVIAVLLVANDEERLGRVLESIRWATVRFVVDLGSTDASLRVAESAGAVCVDRELIGPRLAELTAAWVLLLEGHEVVPPELGDEIQRLTRTMAGDGAAVAPHGAFIVERDVCFLGRRLRTRAGTDRAGIRLLRPEQVSWPRALVSLDGVEATGAVGRLRGRLQAQPYASLHHYIDRMDVLTTARAQAQPTAGPAVGWAAMAVRPAWRVARALPMAVVLDRVAGAVLALLEGYRELVAAAKIWEREGAGAPAAGPR